MATRKGSAARAGRSADPSPAPEPPSFLPGGGSGVTPRDGALDGAERPHAVCPHCGAPLIDHGTTEGPKAGAWHCDVCGGCYVRDGHRWRPRDAYSAPTGWAD